MSHTHTIIPKKTELHLWMGIWSWWQYWSATSLPNAAAAIHFHLLRCCCSSKWMHFPSNLIKNTFGKHFLRLNFKVHPLVNSFINGEHTLCSAGECGWRAQLGRGLMLRDTDWRWLFLCPADATNKRTLPMLLSIVIIFLCSSCRVCIRLNFVIFFFSLCSVLVKLRGFPQSKCIWHFYASPTNWGLLVWTTYDDVVVSFFFVFLAWHLYLFIIFFLWFEYMTN